MSNWHYYESHVTIEPVFNERLEELKELVEVNGFRVADLLMKKREEDKEERSKNDTFCTARDWSFEKLRGRTISVVRNLRNRGFAVWRYKIESTVVDSRYDDSFNLLGETMEEFDGVALSKEEYEEWKKSWRIKNRRE